jgi:pimeloyl-ACP methyl ester carboxylesterase
MKQQADERGPRRFEVTGAGGTRLMAWDYAAATAIADRAAGAAPAPVPAARRESGQAPGPDARPGVLLLHGLLGRASHWAETARRLAPRYRAIALDQRGHGRSERPEGASEPEVYVADAAAAVEQLALAPVTVIGHGLGALTAWQLAAQRPDLVAAVVICEMRAAAPGEAGRRAWEEWTRSWPVPFATLADARRWFAEQDPWADAPGPARGDFFAEVMAEDDDGWRPQYAPAHLLRTGDPWTRDAHWDELAGVGCPALVVRGLDGQLGRAEAQEMVRVLPHGRYAEIADAGHLVPWDQPDAWCETVERFLREVPRRPWGARGSGGGADTTAEVPDPADPADPAGVAADGAGSAGRGREGSRGGSGGAGEGGAGSGREAGCACGTDVRVM